MGAFALRDDTIARWHDYWDTALPGKTYAGEDICALVPASY
ncbi:MAG: hypothetical protein ABW328_14380 [Ilumatobacteraceae bacterium]